MAELKTRIQLRHDTEANWQSVAETLIPLEGEACLTTDGENKGRVKYGDGVTTWGQLPYSGGQDIVEVDAGNVSFDQDLTFTYAFGKYTPGGDGQVTVPAEGKTLEQLLTDAFAEEKNPTTTQPTVSVSSSQMKAMEAGSNITVSYNATLNKGSYSYGPDTGITATSWTVQLGEEQLTTSTGTFAQIQVGDSTNLRITATAQHGDGAIPVTNLGNEYTEGQIKAGSKSGQSSAATGYRQIFYGVNNTTTPLDSDTIRSLTPGGKAAAAITINSIKAQADTKRIIIAVPQSSGLEVTAANITSSLNADVTSSYVKQETPVQVEGANGYTAVPYDVFVYQPASIDATEDHKVVIG